MREPTQKERVLQILIRDGGWLPTFAFENHNGIFVGHRGPARISELSLAYPELIETDRSEKVFRYRFRLDNVHTGLAAYPAIRSFVREELTKAGRAFKEYKTVYEPCVLEGGIKGVRPVRVLA